MIPSKRSLFCNVVLPILCEQLKEDEPRLIGTRTLILKNYSPKAKSILLNKSPRRSRGDYSTILTEPEVNNCFSIITRSDLNRIRRKPLKNGQFD